MGKIKITASINRDLHSKLARLKPRYMKACGLVKMSDSAWIEFCLNRGFPTVLGFVQLLEEGEDI